MCGEKLLSVALNGQQFEGGTFHDGDGVERFLRSGCEFWFRLVWLMTGSEERGSFCVAYDWI